MKRTAGSWDLEIRPRSSWYKIDLGELWRYRDLLLLMVRRDFVSVYKQTILGPLWMVFQPLLTTLTFVIIFGYVAELPTDGVPRILFYLSGITCWTYFADSLTKTSNTFIANAAIFGKVYFPRLIVPISIVISNLFKFGIQFLLFLSIWLYYMFTSDTLNPHYGLFILLPFLLILLAGISLGIGILVSSLTTKYRDLAFFITFGVQLLMFATPVVYPLSMAGEKYSQWLLYNPLTSVIESFKYIFLGSGYFSWGALLYSFLFMMILLFISTFTFNKVERSFMDTV